jgi:beta-glucanase (GH16 family)
MIQKAFGASLFCLIFTCIASGQTGPWQLTFSDEFNGTSLDTSKWATQYVGGGCHNNDEQECYQAANVTASGGVLHLTAKQQTVTVGSKTYNYTSGLIQNASSFSQTYGYFEMRAKLPKGQGFWPAFWTLPNNGNWPPEIDIVEMGKAGSFTTAWMTLHWGTNGSDSFQENSFASTDFSQAFHVYAVDWEPGQVTWYIDGVQRAQMATSNVPSMPMYVLANLAVGGSYPGNVNSSTPLPSNMDIDYIRVWSKASSACYNSIPSPTDPIPATPCPSSSSDTQAPTVPTNLTATTASSSQINLSWTASVDDVAVAGYKVFRAGAQMGTATGTTYQDTGLATATAYSYTVSAYDAAGNTSAQTSAVSATTQTVATDTQAPTVPTNLTATAASPSQVNLSWTASTDNVAVAGYKVFRAGAQVGTPTGTTYQDGGMTASTTYSYTVSAYDAAGNTSAPTSAVSATTQAATLPASTGTNAPAIFFTDLDSGPKTGGESNNGAYVTIYGNNFGTNPTITVGGGQALIKQAPVPSLWYQKLVIQLGANANTGNIVVTNAAGSSNGIPFTVRSGNIYFVTTSGSDSNTGTFTSPWATIPKGKNTMVAGDITYVRGGVVANSDDGYGAPLDISGRNGTATNPIALIAYPGEQPQIGGSANSRGIINYPSGSSYWTIAGFKFYFPNDSEAIYLESSGTSHWRIIGNDISCPNGAGSTGCVTNNDGVPFFDFIGNTLHDVGCPGSMATSPCGDTQKTYHAFYWGDLSGNLNHDINVGWNDVHNVYGCRGIQFHSKDSSPGFEAFNLKVHDNLIYNIRCDAINLANVNPDKGAISVYNNVMYHVGTGPDPSGQAANYTCINTVDSNGAPKTNVEVYNNTCYDGGSRGASEGDAGAYSFYIPTRMRNNLTYQLSAEAYLTSSSQKLCPSCPSGANNLWFGLGTGPSLTGSNINADPKLLNAAGASFQLQASSPAIGAGVAIPGLLADIAGVLRPQSGTNDVGAYQYQAAVITSSACDLTGDGAVDQADVNSAIAQVLGTSACTNAKLDLSASCSVVDVQRVINAANGGTCRVGQ